MGIELTALKLESDDKHQCLDLYHRLCSFPLFTISSVFPEMPLKMQKVLLLTHFKRKGNVDALQNAHAAPYFLDAASVGILKGFDGRGQCLSISKLLAELKKHCAAFPPFSCFQI